MGRSRGGDAGTYRITDVKILILQMSVPNNYHDFYIRKAGKRCFD